MWKVKINILSLILVLGWIGFVQSFSWSAGLSGNTCRSGASAIGKSGGTYIYSGDPGVTDPINMWAACCSFGSSTAAYAATHSNAENRYDCLESPIWNEVTEAAFDLHWTGQTAAGATFDDNNGYPAAVKLVDAFNKNITGWFGLNGVAATQFSEFGASIPKIDRGVVNGAIVMGQSASAGAGAYTFKSEGSINVTTALDHLKGLAFPDEGIASGAASPNRFQYPILTRAYYIYKCPDDVNKRHVESGNVWCTKASAIKVVMKFEQVYRHPGQKPVKTLWREGAVPLTVDPF